MNNRIRKIVVLSLFCVLLSGCGKKKGVEDDFNAIQDGQTTVTNTIGGGDANAVENENNQTPAHVQYSIDLKGAGNKFNVDADVISDYPNKVNVFNMQEITIDKDYLLDLSKKIFDDGEYTVKKPVWLCSISELNEEKEYLDQLVQTFLARGEKEMDDSPILDGYRFEYVPVIDGLENAFTIYTRATTEYDPDREMSEFAEQPVIQIDVDSTGITAVRFGKLYEVGTTMSDETTLITFDAANESVKNAVENTLESYSEINRIKFEYITVQYDKQYVNIPAWVYYVKTGTSETIAIIACNALDGSIIYFEPTLDRYLWYF